MAISLLPLLWELEQPIEIQMQMAEGLTPKELVAVTSTPRERDYSRPWHEYYARKAKEVKESTVDTTDDLKNLEFHLGVRYAEEVSANAAGGSKMVPFPQEKHDGNGLVARDTLHDGCNEDAAKPGGSAYGDLAVSAPEGDLERGVPHDGDKYEAGDEKKEPKKKEDIGKGPEDKEDVEKNPKDKGPDGKGGMKKGQ